MRRGNQNARGSSRRLDPRERAMQRMALYRPEYYDIRDAAVAGRDYVKVFSSHNDTNSFLSRYYKFRMDAIEVGERGARALLFMKATGVDGEGSTFNTRYKNAPPPFTVTWKYEGPAEGTEVVVPQNETEFQQPITKGAPTQPDLAEQLVSKWLKEDRAGETQDQSTTAPGPHICTEWDQYDICVELACRKPKDV